MTDWRDRLPPIPSERIRDEAVREGHRRRELRQRRQRTVLYGGMSAAAVALIVVASTQLGPGGGGDDDDAPIAVDTLTGGTAPEDTGGLESPPPATEAQAGTSAAPSDTIATAATTIPDFTTIGGPIAAMPPSAAITVTPTQIWEQPASGPACGRTRLDVVFEPRTLAPQTPVVHWETGGARDGAPMVVDADRATATIGPFPAATLEEGALHEVLVYVTDRDASGEQIFRASTVILRDCTP